MVRHSGVWIFTASLALVTAAISPLIGESSSEISPRAENQISGSSDQFHSLNPASNQTSPISRFPVPAGSLVIIGSLDISGASHKVTVEFGCSESSSSTSADSDSAIIIEPKVYRRSEVRAACESHCSRDSQDVTAILNVLSDVADTVHYSESGKTNETNTQILPAPAETRTFLVPHFEHHAVIQQASVATLRACSESVSVYVDSNLESSGFDKHRHHPSVSSIHFEEQAAVVCHAIESELLRRISAWISPIRDLDGDGRLSLVITDLDRRDSLQETPVLGCVRNRDFREYGSADFSGDIIYLDHRLPEGNELNALLAHELTHAAVLSRQLESAHSLDSESLTALPSWLNEAISHWVELCFCKSPAGFSERVDQFLTDTASCPIVACESQLPFAMRRGGTRVSSTWFLRRFISDPDEIRRLVFDQRPFDTVMKSITGQPFADLFRTWSIEVAEAQSFMSADRISPQQRMSRKIYGTSLLVIQCKESAEEIIITSSPEAQIQVTVLTPSPTGVSAGEDCRILQQQ